MPMSNQPNDVFTRSLLEARSLPFRPLSNVITVDEFEKSRDGWYLHHIDSDTEIDDEEFSETSQPLDDYDLDWGTVSRSTLTDHWWGSHGGQSGLYSLKVGTQPEAGKTTSAIKRITHPYFAGKWYDRIRFETFFTYHDEPRGTSSSLVKRTGDQSLIGEECVGAFNFEIDIQDRDSRWWPGIRYQNYRGSDRVGHWQYNDSGRDPTGDDYIDIPDGAQQLCWNSPNDSVGWKPNWHYFRLDVDPSSKGYVEMQCNDLVLDLRDLALEPTDRYPHIDGLLNPHVRIETNKDTRSFLYLDSVVLSAEVSPREQ